MRPSFARWGPAVAVLAAAAAPRVARAQSPSAGASSADLHDVRPPFDLTRAVGGPSGAAESAGARPDGAPSAGVLGAFALRGTDRGALADELGASAAARLPDVRAQWSVTALLAFGVVNRLTLGLAVPVVLASDGEDSGGEALASPSLGDLAIGAKLTVREPAGPLGLGAAIATRATFGVLGARSLAADPGATVDVVAVGEANTDVWHAAVSAGGRFRASPAFLGCDAGSCVVRERHAIPAGLSVGASPWALLGTRPRAYVDASFAAGVGGGDARPVDLRAARVGAGVRADWATSALVTAVFVGFDRALATSASAAPLRVFVGLSVAPGAGANDADGDGVEHDLCDDLAEDRDGFEDADGCPEFDDDAAASSGIRAGN